MTVSDTQRLHVEINSGKRAPKNIGAWRSLVAHLLWEQGAGGSNPLAPTNLYNKNGKISF